MKSLATNKKAYFDYEILETFTAGVVLKGSEVKAIKSNLAKLQGAYALIRYNEALLLNCHISRYPFAYHGSTLDPVRTRVLLLQKREIKKLVGKIQQKKLVLLPLKVFISKKGLIKIELGLGKHKKLHEKKTLLRDRDLKREARREIKEH
jgi:SsrA-binding protein